MRPDPSPYDPRLAGHTPHAEYWDRIGDDWRGDRDRLWRAHADAVNRALCLRWLPATRVRRLLKTDAFDEAAGAGVWPVLVERADRVDVIDVAHGVAAAAHARHPGLCVTVADVRALPFAAGFFDAVVSNSTLDHFAHVDDLARGLGELHRVLAVRGRLVLTLDNAAHPLVRLRNALPINWLTATGLVPYYVGATLGPAAAAGLLAELGFRVLDVTAVLHCPRVLAVPVARVVDAGPRGGRWSASLLGLLHAFEGMERWPTRFRTGHFLAVLAERA